MKSKLSLTACLGLLVSTIAFSQQTIPTEYSSVLSSLGRQGDFKEGVLKLHGPKASAAVAKKIPVNV